MKCRLRADVGLNRTRTCSGIRRSSSPFVAGLGGRIPLAPNYAARTGYMSVTWTQPRTIRKTVYFSSYSASPSPRQYPSLHTVHREITNKNGTPVKVNCTLKTDFDKLPRSCFIQKKRRSDGADYVQIDYHLVVENDASGLMKFSLEVDGEEYSAVQASY